MVERKRLPPTRSGRTHHVVIHDPQIGDTDLYVTSNHYEDGALGEIFVNVGKQGSTLQGLLDGWAIQTSIGLQYGVPLDTIIEKYSGQSFSPAGPTSDPDVPQCSSLLDYVVRHLGGVYGNSG